MNFKKPLSLLLTLSFAFQSLALPVDQVLAKQDDVRKPSKVEIKKDIPQYAQLMREFNAVKEEEMESVRPLSRSASIKLDKKVKEEKKTKYTKEELDGVFGNFIDAEEEKLKDLGVDSKKQKQYLNRLKKQKEKIQKPELLLLESKKTEQELKEVKIPDQPSGFNFQNDKIEVKSFGKKKKEASLLKNIYQTIVFWAVPETKADYALTALPELADLESDDQEIALTSEIYSLANELENNPVKIFNFVRNNIDYEPYYGAKKGALGCLKEGVCNDTDATSLTIALMRAAGIPARYKKDFIQVPVDQLQALLGVETTKAVYAGLGKNKVPVYVDASSNLDLSSGFENLDFSQETHLFLEWTYPEIFYELDERGGNFTNETVLTGSGVETTSDLRNELIAYPKKQWIGIDPMMKGYSNTHNEIVPDTASFDTEVFWKNFLQYQGTLSPLEKYASDLLAQTTKDINDAQYQSTKTLIEKEFQVLAPSLPYEIVSNTEYPTAKWSVLPEARKHKVTISLVNGSGTTVLSHELNASEVNNVPIDLFYEGATATDITTIESYGGIHATPVELVEIKPYLNLNYAKYTADQNVQIGETLILKFEYSLNGVDLETSETFSVAGNNEGIYMTFSKIPENVFLDDATDEDQNSKILLEGNAEIARQYLLKMQKKGEALEKALDVDYNLYFGRAVVTQNRVLTKVDGVPTTFDFKGLTIDANLQVVDYSRQGVYSNHNDDFHLLLGLEASYSEAQIFEDISGLESISTVQGLQHAYANPNDYTIHEIESSNETVIDTLTNLSANTRADMHNEVQAGATVITPDDFVSSGNWYGIFYIVLNPDGTARYAIGEQVVGNGGWTEEEIIRQELIDSINSNTLEAFIKDDNETTYIYREKLGGSVNCQIDTDVFERIIDNIDNSGNPITSDKAYYWETQYGWPCLKHTKSFGNIEHTYVLATDGTKFYSPNKYNYWRTDWWAQSVLGMDKNNAGLTNPDLDQEFKFDATAGTYSQVGSYGAGELMTVYYEPNADNDNRGNGWAVYGAIREKIENDNFAILNKIGYPVENEANNNLTLAQVNGSSQNFIGGKTYASNVFINEVNPIVINNASLQKVFYVNQKIRDYHDSSEVDKVLQFGFPESDPYLIDGNESQDFEGTRIYVDSNDTVGHLPVWYRSLGDYHYLFVDLDTSLENRVCFKHYIGLNDGIKIGDKNINGDLIRSFKARLFKEIITSNVSNVKLNRQLNGYEPIAAVNGDFVYGAGNIDNFPEHINFLEYIDGPESLNYSEGFNYSGMGHPYAGDFNIWSSMGISSNNEIAITRNLNELEEKYKQNIIGGGSQIFTNFNFENPCTPSNLLGGGCNSTSYGERQPRTMIGITDNNYMIIVVVGAIPRFSGGATADELEGILTQYESIFGNIEIANMFDGGGSPSMMFGGEVKRQGHNKLASILMLHNGEACN